MKATDPENVDRLELSNLGPIKHLVIEPRALTVLVGPQASGKSLVAQVLYFFRGFRGHLLRWLDRPGSDVETPRWPREAIRDLLDSLRGVPFGYYARGTARLSYMAVLPEAVDWEINVYSSNRRVRVSRAVEDSLREWAGEWSRDRTADVRALREQNVFVPTERSLFARLRSVSLQAMFDERQPEPFRSFADLLEQAGQRFDFFQKKLIKRGGADLARRPSWFGDTVQQLLAFERSALHGEAYLPTHGPQQWKWRVLDDRGEPVVRGRERQPVILPLDGIASGQSEAWPLFVVMAAYGFREGVTFYVEEPETHLHPRAQVAIMRAIAFLLGKGCRFVVTTHSPFILYVLNNLLQAGQRSASLRSKDHLAVRASQIAAYRLGVAGGGQDILDGETGLIDAEEIDAVAGDLGAEFEELLHR